MSVVFTSVVLPAFVILRQAQDDEAGAASFDKLRMTGVGAASFDRLRMTGVGAASFDRLRMTGLGAASFDGLRMRGQARHPSTSSG